MSLLHTLSRITRALARRQKSRRAAPLHGRPWLEAFEDRTVPSVVIDHGHTDIAVGYSANEGWKLDIHLDEENISYPASDALFYAGSNTHDTQSDDPKFAFLGAGAGGDVWVMPQTADPSKIYLGFGLDDVQPGTFDSYFADDPRVQAEGEWIKVSVIEVRGPGEFSMWQTDAAGNPIVWASTFDPDSQDNAYYVVPGGDAHLNWGFTAKGCYEVDLQASAYLNGELTSSDVVTYHFGVEHTCGFGEGPAPSPGAVPPPGQDAGSMSGFAATARALTLDRLFASTGADPWQAAALSAQAAVGQTLLGANGDPSADLARPALPSSGRAATTASPAALDQLLASTSITHSQGTLAQAALGAGDVAGASDLGVDVSSASPGGLQTPRV
jgi:surface-anchored protein